jgi:hypothetical protein
MLAWSRAGHQTAPNCRASPLILPDGKLQTSLVYQLLAPKHDADAAAKFSWDNIAPPRVRFFNWLVTRDRIQSKTNLKMEKIVDNTQCDVCNAREETTQHIFLQMTLSALSGRRWASGYLQGCVHSSCISYPTPTPC